MLKIQINIILLRHIMLIVPCKNYLIRDCINDIEITQSLVLEFC